MSLHLFLLLALQWCDDDVRVVRGLGGRVAPRVVHGCHAIRNFGGIGVFRLRGTGTASRSQLLMRMRMRMISVAVGFLAQLYALPLATVFVLATTVVTTDRLWWRGVVMRVFGDAGRCGSGSGSGSAALSRLLLSGVALFRRAFRNQRRTVCGHGDGGDVGATRLHVAVSFSL